MIDNRLGSGSDYTVFLNFLGVPVADLSFDGPYGVYHSVYDNHDWVATHRRSGVPLSRRARPALGPAALRLADADVLPLDYEPYAERIAEFAAEVERRWSALPGGGAADPLPRRARTPPPKCGCAAAQLQRTPAAGARRAPPRLELRQLDRQLIAAERALLDPDGLPGRPWYRHSIYAPKFTYAPEVLPGVAEAVRPATIARAAARRAACRMRCGAPPPPPRATQN